jgi:hypothetical protein
LSGPPLSGGLNSPFKLERLARFNACNVLPEEATTDEFDELEVKELSSP